MVGWLQGDFAHTIQDHWATSCVSSLVTRPSPLSVPIAAETSAHLEGALLYSAAGGVDLMNFCLVFVRKEVAFVAVCVAAAPNYFPLDVAPFLSVAPIRTN